MPRPLMRRHVGFSELPSNIFKPAGVPARDLKEIVLTVDQAEAIRLADLEGLYHEAAARMMGVSRQTFGRILAEGHKVVASAILKGMVLRIEGGKYVVKEGVTHTHVAVPVRDGMVEEHFGHSTVFTIFEIQEGKIASESSVENADVLGCKTDIAALLVSNGVSALIANIIGDGAIRILHARGITVFEGISGNAREAVEKWLESQEK